MNKKKTEILMGDQITNVRTSPLPLEFLVPKNGKKFMDRNGTVRALQSKISLKFALASAEDTKPKKSAHLDIKQKVIDDFERAYAENCDQNMARNRHRNVSKDNYFHPDNDPPEDRRR